MITKPSGGLEGTSLFHVRTVSVGRNKKRGQRNVDPCMRCYFVSAISSASTPALGVALRLSALGTIFVVLKYSSPGTIGTTRTVVSVLNYCFPYMPFLALPPDLFTTTWAYIFWRKGIVLMGMPLGSKVRIENCETGLFSCHCNGFT